MQNRVQPAKILSLVCLMVMACSGWLQADDTGKMGGWGIDDSYNQFYQARDVEKIKGKVVDVQEVVPMPGMTPGVALLVEINGMEEPLMVHVCPVWYKKPGRIGVRKGDAVSLRGCFAQIKGQEVMMAAKIKYRDKSLKVRLTSDGTPFWTMSPAQLQKELAAD